MVKLNLTEQKTDELDGNWWNRIQVSNFAFHSTLKWEKDTTKDEGIIVECDNDDVLIHKKKIEGERFPSIRYYIVIDGTMYLLLNKDIKKHLKEKLVSYIKEKKILPNKCEFARTFKNNNVQVDYSPTKYDNFALMIEPNDFELPEDDGSLETMIKDLKSDEVKIDVAGGEDCQSDIQSLPVDQYMKNAADSNKGKLEIQNAKIIRINKRRTFYQEHHTSFFIIRVNINDDMHTELNIRISKLIYQENGIKEGDIVSLSGFYGYVKDLGWIIQNVRKIEKVCN